jgi:hypothetical protein
VVVLRVAGMEAVVVVAAVATVVVAAVATVVVGVAVQREASLHVQ